MVASVTQAAGIILAGGLATRMGGGDKGLRDLAGRPLLAHVIDRLAPQVRAIAINANGPPARLAGFGLPVVADSVPGWPGPLAGLLAGMDWAAEQGCQTVLIVPADTPFLPRDLAMRLQSATGPHGAAYAATRRGGTVHAHPVCGLWPVLLRDDLRRAITGGMRRVRDWAAAQEAGQALFDATPIDPFFNINTPEDLARAETLLGRR
ncbi:MAG: molybdenum cofactor guanylyltransferase MobA [Rhodobacteraceae bacterium]|nr:molybdenum cofactor guanylyltransferase MobA [Paracoccaceae bacterium]